MNRLVNCKDLVLNRLDIIDNVARFLMVDYPVLLQQFDVLEYYYEDDFHIVEYYMDKLVCGSGIKDKNELLEILGFTNNKSLAWNFYKDLIDCRHIEETPSGLIPTQLAVKSVQCGKKQVEKNSKRKLYFDAINCKPLPKKFYTNLSRIRSADEAKKSNSYFINTWRNPDQFELENTVRSLTGAERLEYNIPQELKDITFDYEEYSKAADQVQFTPFYIAILRDGSFKTYDVVTKEEETYFRGILKNNPSILHEIKVSTGLAEQDQNRSQKKENVKISILGRNIPEQGGNITQDRNGDLIFTITEDFIDRLKEESIKYKKYSYLEQIYRYDRVSSGDDYLGRIVRLNISDKLLDSIGNFLIEMEKGKLTDMDTALLEEKIKLIKSKRRKL